MLLAALYAVLVVGCSGSGDSDKRLLLATTHTLEDSGMLDSLVAQFRASNPAERLEVIVAGSGEVMAIGERGDADVLLTHTPDAERTFVAAGHGVARRPVMRNSFVIAGPTTDPARAAMASSAADAFTRIRGARQPFVSRADDSGTHRKEVAIWRAAGVADPAAGARSGAGRGGASSYIEAGVGMADALRIADERHAYILTDIATFLTIKDRLDLELLYQGDALLRNEYSVIVVSNARNRAGATLFADWITSAPVQTEIGKFGRSAFGRSLFIGDAK